MVLSLLTALGFLTVSDPGLGWVPLAGNVDITAYAGRFPVRIRDSSSLWILVDFTHPQSAEQQPYLSVRTREEYDCLTNRRRVGALYRHSGRMGRGSIVYESAGEPGSWIAVEPGTIFMRFRALACAGSEG